MLRGLARRLLGVTFLVGGVEAARDADRRARQLRAQAGAEIGGVDAATVSRGLAAAQIGAGLMLVLGRFPRLASLLLAFTVVPDAASTHAFWSEQDKQDRAAQRSLFVRDLGLLGGLLVSASHTGGRASLAHTAKKGVRRAAKHAP